MAMRSLYSAGCNYLPESATNSLHSNCLVITKASSHSGLLTSGILILCAILHRYIITPTLLRKLYGSSYADLQPSQKKKFLLHHVGLLMKILSLAFLLPPAFWVFLRGHHWAEPLYRTSTVTLGDMAFLSITIVASLFIFQLLCEEETKPVHILHHACGVLVIQGLQVWGARIGVDQLPVLSSFSSVAQSCLLWVLFSGIYSVLTTSNNILRRCISPTGSLLHRLYFFTFYSTSVITVAETVAVLYATCVGSPSGLLLKLVVILLQVLFTVTKVLTTLPFYSMGREQRRLCHGHRRQAGGLSIPGANKKNI